MSTFEIISAAMGFLFISIAVWQISKRGVPDDNGAFDEDWQSGG